ncbi:MAG TPA: lysine--tRNA ligase [Candidatus Paceibacterota bacterium]|nr:lysine--tRNA ligase [Candidatus Paceibacterota bacterium]
MASIEELRNDRLKKRKILEEKGINPYPAQCNRTHTIAEFRSDFDTLAHSHETVVIAGRVMSKRGQGGLAFCDVFDGTGKAQILLKSDEMDAALYTLFNDTVDVGDFVEVSGSAYVTKRGEQSLFVQQWNMLTKSLRPIPDSWFGIEDTEERLRKRYLDILQSDELRDLFVKKARFWQSARTFLIQEGFLEVETPVLENTTGGADARPFETHHNALDIDVYLRISAGELWQKRLMVAGYPKTFEIGRIFRNEGMSAEHLQDYTQLEFYWGYADYQKGMDLVERMYRHIAKETFGTLQFTIGRFDIDLGASWERYDYTETIKKYADIDIASADIKEIEKKLTSLTVEYDTKGWNKSRAIDALWKYCRKQIAGPGFLVGVPKELSPLAKSNPNNPTITERFQPIIAGSELGNGYSELNDPVDQAERFAAQAKLRQEGDEEAQMEDTEFVEALEYGMPPTCGFGMSERVFAFLANKSIRDTQLFPLLKPRE